MVDERAATAAILGQLIPQLEYAAPVLLERLERGLPLVERKSPSDLGFDTGMIDAGLLELFRVLAPYVTAAVGGGILGILHERGKKSQEEIRAVLTQMQVQHAALQKGMAEILKVMPRVVKGTVAESEVKDAIARAIQRLASERMAQEQR
jgi:hypothetical protein